MKIVQFILILILLIGCGSHSKRPLVKNSNNYFLKESTQRIDFELDPIALKGTDSILALCTPGKSINFTKDLLPAMKAEKVKSHLGNLLAAICFQKIGKTAQSLFFYQLAHEELGSSSRYKSLILNNLGVMYANVGNYQKALHYFNESRSHYKYYLSPQYNYILLKLMMGMTDKSREQLLKLGVNMGDPEMQFMTALSNFMNLRCSAIGLAEGSPWAKDLQALKESCFYITKKQYKVDLAKIASDQHDSISEMKTKISQQLEKANEKKN